MDEPAPESLRCERVIDCLQSICSLGLSESELLALIRNFLKFKESILAANCIRKNGLDYCPSEIINLALKCPFKTQEEAIEWRSFKRGKKSPTAAPRSGFVYLIRNNRNGAIKIGFSGNPKCREKTLQSEEPEIELIRRWEASMEEERHLHLVFQEKRLRGEWFKLDAADIRKIEAFFEVK